MKPIYLFCLHGCRTGGPEAFHQLSDALIEQGFDARMVYYAKSDVNETRVDGDKVEDLWGIPRQFPDYACPFKEYAHYKAKIARSLDLSQPSIIVLPETLLHMAPLFPQHTVLIWWLSLDNGFNALAMRNLNYMREPYVRHAYQSRYAERVCDALGFVGVGMLSDYTTDLTQYAEPLPWAERPKLVLFNTNHKVIADWPAVIMEVAKLDEEIVCQALPQSSRAGLAEQFARARVYVDLGCFPGKDRGPREAESMGCLPLVLPVGAGGETGAFLAGSSEPAAVAELVVMLVRSEPHYAARHEREIFVAEVSEVFSGL